MLFEDWHVCLIRVHFCLISHLLGLKLLPASIHWLVISNSEQIIFKVRKHCSTFVPCKCPSETISSLILNLLNHDTRLKKSTEINLDHFLITELKEHVSPLKQESPGIVIITTIVIIIIITIILPQMKRGSDMKKGCGSHSPLSWRWNVFVSTEGVRRCIYLPDKASHSKGCSPDSHVGY